MNRLLVALAAILVGGLAWGSPFAIADPLAGGLPGLSPQVDTMPLCLDGSRPPCFDPYDWPPDRFSSEPLHWQHRPERTSSLPGFVIVCPLERFQPCGVLHLDTFPSWNDATGPWVPGKHRYGNDVLGFTFPIIIYVPPKPPPQEA